MMMREPLRVNGIIAVMIQAQAIRFLAWVLF
jgi:hypothetical protein